MRVNSLLRVYVGLSVFFVIAAFTVCCNVAAPGRPEKVYVSDSGRFEAVFPGEPKVEEREIDLGGHTAKLHTVSVETPKPVAKYSVQYFDIPQPLDGPAEEIFDSIIEGGLEETGGRELQRSNTTPGEHPSRTIRAIKADGSFMKVVIIKVNLRIYQVMAYFPLVGGAKEENTPTAEPLADKFINSFKLLPK